jgi:hypothetical protein
LVFVSKSFSSGEYFKSFDIPLALMRHLDFKQPIFGSNYLELTVMPLYGLIPAPAGVKIWFTKGGCDKFLRIFDAAKSQVASQLRAGRMAHDQDFNQKIRNGFFANNSAYQDPNDPTFVYVQQPEATFTNTQQYYGDAQYYQTMNHNYPQHQPPQGAQQPAPQFPTPPGFANAQPPNPHAQPFGGQGMPIGNPNSSGGPAFQQPQPQQQPPVSTNPFDAGHQYPAPPAQGGQNPYAPGGQYPQGMNNPQAAHHNQPGVGYYFGVPVGPQVLTNRH